MTATLRKHQSTLLYGVALAALLILLKWLEVRFLLTQHSFEIYAGIIAVLFTALGVWLALRLSPPRIERVVIEKEVIIERVSDFAPSTAQISQLDISKRELEILNLMALGHSNEEIANKLFVSISTVKSHNQNLFAKLEVKRRAQAVETARRLRIIG